MGITVSVSFIIVERNNGFVINFLNYIYIFLDYLCGG